MIYSDEKGEQLPGKEECQMGSAVWKRVAPDGKCCVEKRSAICEMLCGKEECIKGVGGGRNENEECHILAVECRMGLNSAKSGGGISSATWNWNAPIKAEEDRWESRVALPAEEYSWELLCTHPRLRSSEWNRGLPIRLEGIKEELSQRRSTERGWIDCRMKLKRVNLGWEVLTGIEKHRAWHSCALEWGWWFDAAH